MQKAILHLFKSIKENNENALISPLGLEIILSLLAEGSKGETRRELLELLELSAKSDVLATIENRLKFMKSAPNSTINSENTLYHTPLVSPVNNYIKRIDSTLNLSLKPMNFGKDKVAFIVENYLYIKASWAQVFDAVPHKTEFFTLANGEEIETLFINQSNISRKNKTRYLKAETFHAIQIPLKDEQLCVEVYLPYQKDGLDSFVQNLQPNDLSTWNNQFHEVERMDTYLPKFEVKLDIDFSETLKALGIDELFQPSWDFKPMLESEKTLFLKRITQINTFKLNEHGIEASSTSRGYGGITGIHKLKKFVLFEATHPFLYLVRDKTTDVILFIGLFETPDKQQNFSSTYYNLAEQAKFSQDTEPFSFRFSLALAAYVLEFITTRFDSENDFIKDYLEQIWKLIALKEGKEFNRRATALVALEWPVSYTGKKQPLSKDKNHINNRPGQIISIFYELNEVLDRLLGSLPLDFTIELSNRLRNFSFYILQTLDGRLPNWKLCQPYRMTEESTWGTTILRNDFLNTFKAVIPEIDLTNYQIQERRQNKIIRHLQPKLFDVTIRGGLYIGLICLDKMLEKEKNFPLDLKDWLTDLGDFISTASIDKFDALVLLQFKLFGHTGYFDKNQYFSKEALGIFNAKYPDLVIILDGLGGILASYKYLKAGKNIDLTFKCLLDFLKTLKQHKVDFPEEQIFEQFPIEGGNILGEPIKLDKKRMKNYYEIVD